jgi:hypothetical protein
MHNPSIVLPIKTGIATSGTIGSNAIDTTSISNPVVTAALPPAPVKLGDWVAKGVEGEIYPIRSSIFNASHEIIS